MNDIEINIPLPDIISNVNTSYKIEEFDILYKESDSNAVKVIDTVKITDIAKTQLIIMFFYINRKKPYKTLIRGPNGQSV